MREYIIMADSSCDLTVQEARELGVTILPLTFTVDGQVMQDTPDHAAMAPEEFYERLKAGADCSTAAANVGEFADAMGAAVEQGKDVLCLCLSAALSTTYQSAQIAAKEIMAEHPETKIIVLDSASASRGIAMILYRIVKEKREKQPDIETLAAFAETAVKQQTAWAFVDDLNQLKRGGRISAMTALAGTALGIKPILQFSKEGALMSSGKARGIKSATKLLVDRLEEKRLPEQASLPIFVAHANCPEYVQAAEGMLRERFGDVELHVGEIGPVIGSHTGGGTLVFFFAGEKE